MLEKSCRNNEEDGRRCKFHPKSGAVVILKMSRERGWSELVKWRVHIFLSRVTQRMCSSEQNDYAGWGNKFALKKGRLCSKVCSSEARVRSGGFPFFTYTVFGGVEQRKAERYRYFNGAKKKVKTP